MKKLVEKSSRSAHYYINEEGLFVFTGNIIWKKDIVAAMVVFIVLMNMKLFPSQEDRNCCKQAKISDKE